MTSSATMQTCKDLSLWLTLKNTKKKILLEARKILQKKKLHPFCSMQNHDIREKESTFRSEN